MLFDLLIDPVLVLLLLLALVYDLLQVLKEVLLVQNDFPDPVFVVVPILEPRVDIREDPLFLLLRIRFSLAPLFYLHAFKRRLLGLLGVLLRHLGEDVVIVLRTRLLLVLEKLLLIFGLDHVPRT